MILPDPDPSCVRLAIKAVPGSRRDQIVGPLGDRLKIKVAAPPEAGKANDAIVALLAETLGVRDRDITILSGHTNPEKVVRIAGLTAEAARRALGG